MEMRYILTTVFEISVAAFIVYGLLHEDRFAAAERKAVEWLKDRLCGSHRHGVGSQRG